MTTVLKVLIVCWGRTPKAKMTYVKIRYDQNNEHLEDKGVTSR